MKRAFALLALAAAPLAQAAEPGLDTGNNAWMICAAMFVLLMCLPGLALFYGGTAQLLAGMWEYKRGNTFGATAFASFGAFWLSFWALEKLSPKDAGDIHQAVGLYLLAWCIFTAYMTLAALRTNLAVLAVFVLLTLTFLFLAIGAFMNDMPAPDTMTKVGGWFGIVTAVVAWYASSAAVVNATHGKTVLPTWPR